MKLKDTEYAVVPRMEPWEGLKRWKALLFFPDQPELHRDLSIYAKVGQHGTSSRAYFYRTRPPHTIAEWKECCDLMEEERTLGPKEDWLEAVIVTGIGR
jgi:hypothetical protein